jgi:hypothetical protein
MSIVAVHGPNTFGSMAVTGNAVVVATVDPANALLWTFRPVDQSQAAANYDWAYTPAGGSPASPIADTKNPVITFTGAVGSTKTVTLTLNGVAQPALVITIPPSTGGASLRSLPPEGGEESGDEEFDPADYTIPDVVAYAEDNPDQLEDIIAAEEAGKARSTLLSQLEAMRSA